MNVVLNRTVVVDSDWRFDNRTGCRNVSHCQQQQSYSGLRSPGRSNSTFWNDSWAQTFHKINIITIININIDNNNNNNNNSNEDLDQLLITEPQYRFWNSMHVVILKLLHFALLHYASEKLLQFALKISLHFASMLLHFTLVLHFTAILITFCANITFCGVTSPKEFVLKNVHVVY